jgi:hypothetical protein
MSSTGINWGSLLPLIGAAGSSLFGASTQNGLNTAAQNAARNSQQLYSFGAGTPSGVGGTYTANPGGLGGNVGLNFGNLTGANNQLQGLAGMFAGAAGTNQVPSALTSGANNAFGQATNLLNGAVPDASNYFGAANTQLAAAGQDPAAYASGVYNNLTAQAKPWEDAQTASLADSQFGKGQAGTSGGALQTQAFAQGLGTADLQRQITAQQMGQQQQAQAVSNAGALSGQGNALLQNAFSNFNQTQNQQQQLAALPSYLQSLNLQNSGSALGQQAGIQTQAQSLLNTGLTANTANGNLLLGAAGQLGANANGANTSQNPYANLLQSLFGSAANSATNSAGNGILQQLFGNSSAAGGEAAPAAAGTAGQTFAPIGATSTAGAGGTSTLFGEAAGAPEAGAAGTTTTFGDAAGSAASQAGTAGATGAAAGTAAAAGSGAVGSAGAAALAQSGGFATGGAAGSAGAGASTAAGSGLGTAAGAVAPLAAAALPFLIGMNATAKTDIGSAAMSQWMQTTGAKFVAGSPASTTYNKFGVSQNQLAGNVDTGYILMPNGTKLTKAQAASAITTWGKANGVNTGDFNNTGGG